MSCSKGCPSIKKSDWEYKKHNWKQKAFYKKGFLQFLHMPLNIGSAINNGWKELKNKGYKMKSPYIMLQEETGFFTGKVLFMLTSKPKKKDDNVIVWKNKTLYSKYYKGEFRFINKAFEDLTKYVKKTAKKDVKKFFLWTVDCPECWKENNGPTNVLFAMV